MDTMATQIKENFEAPRHWPLWGVLTGHRSGLDSKNIPYFRENLIFPGNRRVPDSENIPYFREIWWNHTLF